jgi:hypothetical protein
MSEPPAGGSTRIATFELARALLLGGLGMPIEKGSAMSHKKIMSGLCAAVSLSLVAACAGAPPPKDRMAWAEATVREAQAAGAESVPSANSQLNRARSEILRARALSAKNENDQAESMLRRAAADAQLAIALAREAQAHEQALTQARPVE